MNALKDFVYTNALHPAIVAWESLKTMNYRQMVHQALSLALVVMTALMIWKGLGVVVGTESPIVVVLSGSMEPAFYRGDILFLFNPDLEKDPLRVGEILVFEIEGRDIPIVHRIVEIREPADPDDEIYILTKGDNNNIDDRGLYHNNEYWIRPKDVLGRARGWVPKAGYMTILLNDNPQLKYLFLACMAIAVLSGRE